MFEEEYEEYTTTVSSKIMAASFKMITYLYEKCLEVKPKIIADFGTGFSSFVLRTYAKEFGTTIYSIDDNPKWLKKTKDFLTKHDVSIENLWIYDEATREILSYQIIDFIFYDLGSFETRRKEWPLVQGLLTRHNRMILDDMHIMGNTYVSYIKSMQGFKLISLKKQTLDEYGRYAGLVLYDSS